MQETIKIIKKTKRKFWHSTAEKALEMALSKSENTEYTKAHRVLEDAIAYYDFLRGESPHFSDEITLEKTISIQE